MLTGLFAQLVLVGVLVLVNAAFAGTELALVSLRDGQLQRLEAEGGRGAVLASLARDPNRFLATIQIGITLAGFLASASAAVSLAAPLERRLGVLGGVAGPISIVLVTLVLAYVTLVFGELAPKRVAMQRAEGWGLVAARPLAVLSKITRPTVWLLAVSADVVVRLVGADPSRQREDVTEEELRDMVAAQATFSEQQRDIIAGAFEVASRRLHQVVRPRRDVVTVDAEARTGEAAATLVDSGHSRAPVVERADLDHVVGVIHLRDLVAAGGSAGERASPVMFLPESVKVLDALRQMQLARQQLAIVINEHGGAEGIVTIEDLLEEIVGEIYDESDRDVLGVERRPNGSLVLPGHYPVHDLPDVGVEAPGGDYATVAGLVLDRLGHIPETGERVEVAGWELTVLAVEGRAITRVGLERVVGEPVSEAG